MKQKKLSLLFVMALAIVAMVATSLPVSASSLLVVQTNGVFIEAQDDETGIVVSVGTGGATLGYKHVLDEVESSAYVIGRLGISQDGTYISGTYGRLFEYQGLPLDGRLGVLFYTTGVSPKFVAGVGVVF